MNEEPTQVIVRNYESRARFLGLPLVCIRYRMSGWDGNPVAPAKGWIAFGDRAHGVLLAVGGIAMGGVAVGGLSAGVASVGGLSLGLLSIGGLAVGGWAIGGLAIGYMSIGGLALAWHAAFGGLAIAHDVAIGGKAIAEEANTQAAKALFESNGFFRISNVFMNPWFKWALMLGCFGPMIVAGLIRKKHPK